MKKWLIAVSMAMQQIGSLVSMPMHPLAFHIITCIMCVHVFVSKNELLH